MSKRESNDEDAFELLKARKGRVSKKKRRRVNTVLDDTKAEAEGEGDMSTDIHLIKEAQRMRDAVRRAQRKPRPTVASKEDETADASSGFAAERATHLETERMARYVEERMHERFGGGDDNSGADSPKPTDVAKQFEEELYSVPEHLNGKERAPYDPAAGLPAGGVEEVAVDAKLGKGKTTYKVKRR